MDIVIEKIIISLRSDPVLKNHLIVKIDEYKNIDIHPTLVFSTYLLITH
jgi:hypothetical protein